MPRDLNHHPLGSTKSSNLKVGLGLLSSLLDAYGNATYDKFGKALKHKGYNMWMWIKIKGQQTRNPRNPKPTMIFAHKYMSKNYCSTGFWMTSPNKRPGKTVDPCPCCFHSVRKWWTCFLCLNDAEIRI